MADLSKLFKSLQNNKQDFLRSEKGADFEDRVSNRLHNLGYSRVLKSDISKNLAEIKTSIQAYQGSDALVNPTEYQSHYVLHPAGKQDYPDFLIMEQDRLISIEVKYSGKSQPKPMWNSGLPRPHGIYIFGSYGCRDITFFMGRDILSPDDVMKLQAFFAKLKKEEHKFNFNNMLGQPYGFEAYSRKAFSQSKQYSPNAITDYFANPNRKKLEENVIAYVK